MSTDVPHPHVDIYLRGENANEWIPALTIPHADITRLTTRPLKWLRFATFAVCGTKGHLSATPGGDPVNYDVSLDDILVKYYYIPDSEYHFIDIQAYDGQCTQSTASSQPSSAFHRKIHARDVSCVFTGYDESVCDAAHIIARRKGDTVGFLVSLGIGRHLLFHNNVGDDVDVDINCVQNGMLLNSLIHRMFDRGFVAFLRTPNFAMEPADVPRVEHGPTPPTRITLQHVKLCSELYLQPQCDTRGTWSPRPDNAPLDIFLDFMYGVAIASRFKSDDLRMKLERWFDDTYKTVLANTSPHGNAGSEDDDELLDAPWEPGRVRDAMDEVLYLPMLLKGVSPEMMATEWRRRRQEEDLLAKEHSCEKVQQWQASNASYLSGTNL